MTSSFSPARSNAASEPVTFIAAPALTLLASIALSQPLPEQGAPPQLQAPIDPVGADAKPEVAVGETLRSTARQVIERLRLTSSLRAGVWTQDRDFNDEPVIATTGLRARIAPRAGYIDAFAEGYVQAANSRGVEADLVEGWVRYTHDNLSLKAGRQIVVWGRADRLNPSDVLSSRDYTLLFANDDEQRRGALTLQARLGLGAFTLDGYWLPEFRDNRFPLELNPVGAIVVPDKQVRDSRQFAARLDRSGGSVDWSVAWFHGIDRTRDFVRAPLPADSEPGALAAVQQAFPAVDVVAADVAGVIGRIGWRAEVAHSDYRGADSEFRKNDNFWLVGGIDTDIASGWNLNLQYSLRRIFDYSDPRDLANPIDRAIASQSAAVNNQLDRAQHGMTARIAHKWFQETLDFELSTIVWFQTADAAIRPKFSYSINDRLRVTAAADIFVGPRLSYFGRVRELTAGFVQLNYGF